MDVWVKIFIKSLRIENFKSYIGKSEAGPCHPNINAIVGPNGSGKSNFLDAILFVMGKKAIELRFRCLTDIISFSKIKKPICASVTVNFRLDKPNQKDWTLDIIEFYISRKIFKKNLSVYFLNGKEIKFLELIKIVSKKRIPLKNDRCLVQQGEIEKISTMKSSGKNFEEIGTLEYIEGVFGTNRYLYLLNEKQKTRNLIKLEISSLQKTFSLKKFFKNQKKFIYENKKSTPKKIYTLRQVLNLFRILGIQYLCLEISFSEKIRKNSILMKLFDKRKNLFENVKKVFCGNFLQLNEIKNNFRKIQNLLQQNLLNEQKLYFSYKKKKNYIKKSQTSNAFFYKNPQTGIFKKETSCFKINQEITEHDCIIKKKFPKLFSKGSDFFPRKISIYSICAFIHCYYKRKRGISEEIEELWLKNDQSIVFLEKLNFLLNQFFHKNSEKDGKLKKKGSKKFFEMYFSSQRLKIISENRNLFYSIETFSLVKYNETKEGLPRSSDIYSPLNNYKKFSNNKQTEFGILGQIGSLGYLNLRLGLPFISVMKGELRSFLIDKVSNSLSLVELFHKEKMERVKLLVSEKIKPFPPRKKNRKSKKLFDKIFTNKAFEHVFHYLVQETLIVENLSDGIQEVFESVNRKRVVTLKGEIIEKSGVFSGGKLRTDYYEFVNQSLNNSPKWIYGFSFFRKQSSIIRNLRLEKVVKKGSYKKEFHEFRKDTESSNFNSFFNLEKNCFCKKEIKFIGIDFIKLFFEKFPIMFIKNDTKFSKFRKKSKIIIFGIIHNKHLFWLKYISVSSVFELAQKNKFKEKGQNLMTKRIEKKIKKATFLLRLVSRNFMLKKIKNFYEINRNQLNFFNRFLRPMEIMWKFNSYYTNSLNLRKKFLSFFLGNFQEFTSRFTQMKNLISQSVFCLENKIRILIKERLRIKHELKRILLSLKKFEGFSLNLIHEKINFQEIKWKKFLNVVPSSKEKKPNTSVSGFGLKLTCLDLPGIKKVLPKNLRNYFKNRKLVIQKFKKKKLTIRVKLVSRNSKQIHFQRLTDFIQNLFVFEQNLNLTYRLFSQGGIVDIELLDETDPFSQGLILSPKHPEKSWRSISQLSGGEKTLGSLAVVFSLQISKSVPWYLFDEIDAALDFKNVSKISSYIYFSSQYSQILIISLRSNMFRSANHIFGITKINDETKMITLKM